MRCLVLSVVALTPSLWGDQVPTPRTPREQSETLLRHDGGSFGSYLNGQPKANTATKPLLMLARRHGDDPVTDTSLQRAFNQAFLVARSTEDAVERTEQLCRLGMAQTRQGKRDEAR